LGKAGARGALPPMRTIRSQFQNNLSLYLTMKSKDYFAPVQARHAHEIEMPGHRTLAP
jgi:hypothetical protein